MRKTKRTKTTKTKGTGTMQVKVKGGKRILDVRLRFEDDQVDRIILAAEMTGLSSLTQAVRYVLNRGMESLAPQIRQKQWMDEIERKLSPQELLPFVRELERRTGPDD